MRRKDREVTDIAEIQAIVSQCEVCRLALNGDDGFPYILPLNFGYLWESGQLTLFFHSAMEGKKHELIAVDHRASFEMDGEHDLFSVAEKGYCTMNYASVIGRGEISYIEDEDEKMKALSLMTDRYHAGRHFEFSRDALPRTSVYKLTVQSLTAKRKSSKR